MKEFQISTYGSTSMYLVKKAIVVEREKNFWQIWKTIEKYVLKVKQIKFNLYANVWYKT